jgi:hypothetical protein
LSARSLASSARRLRALGGALLLGVGVAACGQISHPTRVDNEGEYVDAGPVTYQVQVSRQLNPFAPDDRQFLAGATGPPPAPSQMWFGIWLWAKNQTHTYATTSDSFEIVDTVGHPYYPIPINRQVNPFAWASQTLAPGATEPTPSTASFYVPSQGGFLLFKLNNTVYSNRPLTLRIYAPGQAQPSTVSLDL